MKDRTLIHELVEAAERLLDGDSGRYDIHFSEFAEERNGYYVQRYRDLLIATGHQKEADAAHPNVLTDEDYNQIRGKLLQVKEALERKEGGGLTVVPLNWRFYTPPQQSPMEPEFRSLIRPRRSVDPLAVATSEQAARYVAGIRQNTRPLRAFGLYFPRGRSNDPFCDAYLNKGASVVVGQMNALQRRADAAAAEGVLPPARQKALKSAARGPTP